MVDLILLIALLAIVVIVEYRLLMVSLQRRRANLSVSLPQFPDSEGPGFAARALLHALLLITVAFACRVSWNASTKDIPAQSNDKVTISTDFSATESITNLDAGHLTSNQPDPTATSAGQTRSDSILPVSTLESIRNTPTSSATLVTSLGDTEKLVVSPDVESIAIVAPDSSSSTGTRESEQLAWLILAAYILIQVCLFSCRDLDTSPQTEKYKGTFRWRYAISADKPTRGK
jgi:hypothetical protein